MRTLSDKLSQHELDVLNAVAGSFSDLGHAATVAHVLKQLPAPAGIDQVGATLDELHPVFVRDASGSACEPTLDGWLASSLGPLVTKIIQAAIDALREAHRKPVGARHFAWEDLTRRVSLKDAAFPIALRVLELADLSNHGDGDGWSPRLEFEPDWSFAAPDDVDEVIQYSDAVAFLELRRREPRALRNLRRMWNAELDTSCRTALQLIYSSFDEDGVWPSTLQIDRQLRREKRKGITETASSSLLIRADFPHDERCKASLTFAGLFLCKGAEKDRALLVKVLSALGRIALDGTGRYEVSAGELLTKLGLTEQDLTRVIAILDRQSNAYITTGSNDLRFFHLSTKPRMIEFADASRFEDILLAEYRDNGRIFEGVARVADAAAPNRDLTGVDSAEVSQAALEQGWGAYPTDQLADPPVRLLRKQRLLDDLTELLGVEENIASVFMLDIDHFKNVNDKHGHVFGDEVLCRVSDIVRSVIGRRGTAYRFGGEELVGVLPDFLTSEALSVAERIRAAVEVERWADVPEFRVTVSVGVAQRITGDSSKALIDRADKALYRCKETGRNRCSGNDETSSAGASTMIGVLRTPSGRVAGDES